MERGRAFGAGEAGVVGPVRDGVAIIDDEPLVLRAVRRILAPTGHALVTAPSLEALGDPIHDPRLAVVVLDLFMGGADGGAERGLAALDTLRRERPDVAVVVMTGRASIESAVSCMRSGAFDYLCKPFTDIERVRESVAAAAAHARGDGDAVHGPKRPLAGPRDLASDWLRVPLVSEPADATDVPLSLEAYERLALERALREAAGDAADAARRLGIGRSTFYRRARKLGVALRTGEGAVGPDADRVGAGPPIG